MNIGASHTLQQFWQRLAPREQRAVRILALVLAVVVFYLALWMPLQKSISRLRAEVPRQAGELAIMRAQAALVQDLRRGPPPVAPAGGLTGLIERSSTAHGLRAAFSRIDAEGANGVRVQIDASSFNAILVWLTELQQQNAVRVESATFERHTLAGSVSARLVLRGPGA